MLDDGAVSERQKILLARAGGRSLQHSGQIVEKFGTGAVDEAVQFLVRLVIRERILALLQQVPGGRVMHIPKGELKLIAVKARAGTGWETNNRIGTVVRHA